MTTKEIEEIKQYISDNLGESFTIEKLAEKYGVTERVLNSQFKSYTGELIRSYIVNLKMQKAKEYLDSGISCKKVAPLIGYGSYDSYKKIFTRTFGVSPSQYAASLKAEQEKQPEASEAPKAQKAPQRKCGEGCGGCIRWRSLSGTSGDFACNYLLDTGEIRGCPPGKDCIRYDNDPEHKKQILEKIKNDSRWGLG